MESYGIYILYMVYIVVYKYNPIKYKSLQKSPKSSTSMARSVAAAAAQARRRAAAPGRGPTWSQRWERSL